MRSCWRVLKASGIALIASASATVAQSPVGAAFTYQGQLNDGSAPADGVYDLAFRLFDAGVGGAPLDAPVCVDNVVVTNGLFTVLLDFGGLDFNGDERFLEIQVRRDAGSSCEQPAGYTTHSPRQPLTAAPYATYATGNWGLGGNAGTGEGDFLGTTDNVPLELRVNNQRAVRYWTAQVPDSYGSMNILAGAASNWIAGGAVGATVAGGGGDHYYSRPNWVTGDWGTVSGGQGNWAGASGTVAGGTTNSAESPGSPVRGGVSNRARLRFSIAAGGFTNDAAGDSSTVSGGRSNRASGSGGTVPGGVGNRADGASSFAAGQNAHALHDYCFVWADSQTSYPMASSAPNQFLIQTTGGVGSATLAVNGGIRARGGPPGSFGVNNNGYAFAGNGGDNDSGLFGLADGTVAIFTNSQERLRVGYSGGVAINTASPVGYALEVNGVAAKPGGGSWTALCDARVKTNITPLEGTLDRLLTLRGCEFEYVPDAVQAGRGLPGRQIGLIAQEVEQVFPEWVERDSAGYLSVTERGTTALLVEALRDLRAEKDKQLALRDEALERLRQETALLRAECAAQRARLSRIEELLERRPRLAGAPGIDR